MLADPALVSIKSWEVKTEAALNVSNVGSSCDVGVGTLVVMVLSTVVRMLELAISEDVPISRREDVTVSSVGCFDKVGELETGTWLVV